MAERPTTYRRTALFVDFENVYLGLRHSSPRAAKTFATHPRRWVDWMEQSLGPLRADLDDGSRAILRRTCYLDPAKSGGFRTFFTRAGFRVVDCPALTQAGKNSADIHMVLDIVDTLRHATWFDEFILLSADADFTPVLLRLREHDRRTAMLLSGPAAQSLQAACDYAIPYDVFLDEALGLGDQRTDATIPRQPGPGDGVTPLHDRIADVIRETVAASSGPVTMASVAQTVQNRLGDRVVGTNWAGHGSFGALVGEILGPTLDAYKGKPPGWLYDPKRHSLGDLEQAGTSLPDGAPEIAELVNRVVGAPLLSSESYAALFAAIIAHGRSVADHGQAKVEQTVRDALSADGRPVPRSAVRFVLLAFQFLRLDWTDEQLDAGALASGFVDNVLRMADNAPMDLDDTERSDVRRWITGAE